ncbi:MAG TPA: hypothetical protein VIK89_08925 [Cytophagaceae bacterium]
MALKTLVKVGEVNNLSDARYCAGMGVEMIGFPLSSQSPHAVSIEKAVEISNWLAGVQLVGEFDNTPVAEINEIAKKLNLNYVQLTENYQDSLDQIEAPVILKLTYSDTPGLISFFNKYHNQVAYFLVESNNSLESCHQELVSLCEKYPVIIGFDINKGTLPLILDNVKPSGINLKGGNELKPGLKDFEELAEILEELEESD